MKKRSSRPQRSVKAAKKTKPLSRTTLYFISASIVLVILFAAVQQPQSTRSQAQMAMLTPPVPSANPTISGPQFGCLGGNCPMQITPVLSQPVISPGANAPIPGVSGAPAVSGVPGGAQNPGQVPGADGNPLQFLENPNGKVPPGRAKNFLEQFFAFFLQLFGGGGDQPQQGNQGPGGGNQGPGNGNGNAFGLRGKQLEGNRGPGGGGDQPQEDPQADPDDPDQDPANGDDPANGGNQGPGKPGFGNNPGTVNPGGHEVNPPGKGGPNPGQGAGAGAGAGASAPGALNQPGATNGGAVNQQPAQPNGFEAILNFFRQLFGGQAGQK